MNKYALFVVAAFVFGASDQALPEFSQALSVHGRSVLKARANHIDVCQEMSESSDAFETLRNYLILDRLERDWIRCAELALHEYASLEQKGRYFTGAAKAALAGRGGDFGQVGDYCLSFAHLNESVVPIKVVQCLKARMLYEASISLWNLGCESAFTACEDNSVCLGLVASEMSKVRGALQELEGTLAK